MKHDRILTMSTPAFLLPVPETNHATPVPRWPAAKARAWYAKQRWPIGSNYVPADAINQLEMWQADTFNALLFDRELGWAERLGMTTMRVFLHDLLWKQDAAGFKKRIDVFLDIAAKHGIKPMFVLFDSCWNPDPQLGPQHSPLPGIHNSGWVQGPGLAVCDPSQYSRLESYVRDIVGYFGHDQRILLWDVWNEPDNPGGGTYDPREPKDNFDRVAELLPQVFAWARSVSPSQPLTSGVWQGEDWSDPARLNAVERIQLEESDVISFHNYGLPEMFLQRVQQLQRFGRPLLCTEYMARCAGSTIDGVLPLAKQLDVGMVNWGFVEGKTQTSLPWDSWLNPYALDKPVLWFHDLLHADGTPYSCKEAEMIQALATSPRGIVPVARLLATAVNNDGS